MKTNVHDLLQIGNIFCFGNHIKICPDVLFRYLYKCVRGSQWGDKLPVTWPVTWSSQLAEESLENSAEELSESSSSLQTEENSPVSGTDYQLNHRDFDSQDDQRFSEGQGCLSSEEPVQTDPSRQFT